MNKIRKDIRDLIFFNVKRKRYLVHIVSQGSGILSGTKYLKSSSKKLRLQLLEYREGGERIYPFDYIASFYGRPKQIARAEEELMGWIAKASGIATAAWKAKKLAGEKLRVVCGAWKKMPLPIKELIRQAIVDGGIDYRISQDPFIYLDKNYIKILGGVREALIAVKDLHRYRWVVQLKSKGKKIIQEAIVSAELGADIIMIDTGVMKDVEEIDRALQREGLRGKVKLAFAGDIKIEDLKHLRDLPLDIVDIGRAIVDAPLLDMRMDVEKGIED